MNETFLVSEGFIHVEKLNTQIWLDCSCAAQCNLFPLERYLSQPLTSQPLNLEHILFLFQGSFICATHFMNSNCKYLTFSSLQANIGSDNKSPPGMTFNIHFHILLHSSMPLCVKFHGSQYHLGPSCEMKLKS